MYIVFQDQWLDLLHHSGPNLQIHITVPSYKLTGSINRLSSEESGWFERDGGFGVSNTFIFEPLNISSDLNLPSWKI